MKVHIVIVSPPGWRHARLFAEIAECLIEAFTALGHHATGAINKFHSGALNVVLGAFQLPHDQLAELPARTVIYNLEQLDDPEFDWLNRLAPLFRRFEVWDYSERNLALLGEAAPRRFLLPIGTMPGLTRIAPAAEQDIDVLFYGATSERRCRIFDRIKGMGLDLRTEFGLYGPGRDALIARAKIVLNLHKSASQIFELVRVSYLMANRKAVVTEDSGEADIPRDLRNAVHAVSYEELPDACAALVAGTGARHALEERAYGGMAARHQDRYLQVLLDERAKTISD